MAKLAVIDIGTNSIHMVLAEILPDASYKILDRFKDMTRLGDGAFTTKRLSDDAVARALDILKTLVTLARNKGFDRIVAVATSAVREARNGGEFTQINLAWLNWWLKGDESATGKGMLVGANCRFCNDRTWQISSANLP